MSTNWRGVFPAVTTKFDLAGRVDAAAMNKHIDWQIKAGVHGIIILGTLGENAVLSADEKMEVVKIALEASAGRVPVLATVAETTTQGACNFAKKAAEAGVAGFMVLPGMLYVSDAQETMTHFRTVAKATDKPIMIYNNPVSYRVDITPEMFAELADEPSFVAIKESSDDVRRLTDIRNLVGDRYQIFTGVDDLAFESLVLGAVGWVAGLVCAFPRETVAIYELVQQGRINEAREIYRWFMPLLHLDVSTKLVQNIKLAEAMVGCGTEHVRAPRLILAGEERERAMDIISKAIENRPKLPEFVSEASMA